jgi:ribosome-associated heat shock protein Hsp15
MSTEKMRIDKWLWAVRLNKTRTQAATLCNEGKVTVNGQPAKASKTVKAGDVIAVRKGAFTFEYKVLKEVHNRQPAREVMHYVTDITPEHVIEQFKTHLLAMKTYRQWGSGRPTKKDRRNLENFLDW